MSDMREEIVQHYANRVMDVNYWNHIIPTDPAEVARIYTEIQKEIEQSKRIGKRPHFQTEDGFIFYETYYLDEDKPTGSQ